MGLSSAVAVSVLAGVSPMTDARGVRTVSVRARAHCPISPLYRYPRCSTGRSVRVRAMPLMVRAAAKGSVPEAEDARGAIALGLKLYTDGDYTGAYELFTKVVKDQVPGTGLKRFRDKPPVPSQGEKMAALYNIACCQAKLGDIDTGLAAFAGALENGFDDLATARSDPDLAALREDDRFEGLLTRAFPSPGNGPFSWLAYQMDFKNSAIARVMKNPK